MQIGITGITGLIGRHVAALARQRGHTVVGYSRSSPAHRRLIPGVPPDLSGCDAVINLAGESVAGLWTSARRRSIRDSRILGTRAITEAMRRTSPPPRVLVSASAIGFYGNTGDTPADERTALPGAGFLAKVCESWEQEALRSRESGTRVVLLRTGIVLSPEGGALAAMLPIFRLGLGGKLGNGRQWMSWIHMEDEAALVLAAVENESIHGPLNATAPNPSRNADFTRALAQALHRPAFFTVPAAALRVILGGFSSELLESRRILPAAASAAGYTFRFSNLEPALKDLMK